jgi:hypothetical protein
LVGNSPVGSGHQNPAYLFPRRDGVYYALTSCKRITTDPVTCENFERFLFGGFTKSPVSSPDRVPCHPFMAASVDGWMVRKLINPDWSETFELGKLPLPPKLCIKDAGASIEVRWDQQTAGDVLEQSSDQKTWTECHHGPPPAVLPKEGSAYFRVRQ